MMTQYIDSIPQSQPPLSALYTVYDVRDLSFNPTNLFPLLFVLIGIGFFFYHKHYGDPNEVKTASFNKRTSNMAFGIIFAVGALLMFLSIYFSGSNLSRDMIKTYESGKYKIVQGFVKNFHPMPAEGHEDEYFDVDSVHFNYSYFAITGSYNKTATYGGAIKNGLYVQITYSNSTYITENDTHPILILKVAK